MKLLKVSAVATIAISSLFVFSACSKSAQEQKQAVKTSSPLAIISNNCNAVGELNIAEITKIPEVAKNISERKDLPYVKEVSKVGLDLNNISMIDIGIAIPNKPISLATSSNESNGIIIIRTKKSIDVGSFIKLAEQNKDTTFKNITISGTKGYVFEDTNPATAQKEELYVVQLNDNMIIIGTEKEVTASVALSKGEGTSIIENKSLSTLTKDFSLNNMFWFAVVVPSGLYENSSKNVPNIENGIITADYANKTLSMDATINCKTKDDVQKITLPFQMVSSFIIMSSNNLIKPENMTVNTKENQVSIHVALSSEAIQTIIAQQLKAQQEEQQSQSIQQESDLSEEGVISQQDSSSEK